MLLEENFDADEILREGEETFLDDDTVDDEDARELNFGNMYDENANFRDLESDLNVPEDLWQ